MLFGSPALYAAAIGLAVHHLFIRAISQHPLLIPFIELFMFTNPLCMRSLLHQKTLEGWQFLKFWPWLDDHASFKFTQITPFPIPVWTHTKTDSKQTFLLDFMLHSGLTCLISKQGSNREMVGASNTVAIQCICIQTDMRFPVFCELYLIHTKLRLTVKSLF